MTPLNPFTYKFLNAQGDLKDFKHKSCQNEVERGKKKKNQNLWNVKTWDVTLEFS